MLRLHSSTTIQLAARDATAGTRRLTAATPVARATRSAHTHSVQISMVMAVPPNPQGEGLEQGLAKLENSLIDRWFGKLGVMREKLITEQRATCCYCGPEAGKDGQPCTLSCVCAWELAADLMKEIKHEAGLTTPEDEENINWADRNFQEILYCQPDNQVLLADYAMFLWRTRGDFNGAEQMLKHAMEAPCTNELVRMKILNLYSLFMSISPPSAANLEKQRKLLESPPSQ
jgi:hypothetical protein